MLFLKKHHKQQSQAAAIPAYLLLFVLVTSDPLCTLSFGYYQQPSSSSSSPFTTILSKRPGALFANTARANNHIYLPSSSPTTASSFAIMNGLRARGGAATLMNNIPAGGGRQTTVPPPKMTTSPTAAAAATTTSTNKKVRITAFDSMRFFLIMYIVCGHFIKFVDPSDLVWKAMTQINVVVGAFFALSGYVAAYTTTENNKCEASPKLLTTPSPKWILSRIFGYYPLHLATLLLFLPVFAYPDVHFSGWPTAIGHGLMSAFMTQAWFPMHAEVWNAPTWFLSSLTFATIVLRFALPIFAKMNKKELRRTCGVLSVTSLLPKLGYCYDTNGWKLTEGILSPKQFPGLALYNVQRFNPFFASIEVLLGAVACRLVMLDDAPKDIAGDGGNKPKTNQLSTLLPLVGMISMIVLRSTGTLTLSDMLCRSLWFIPMFLKFLMASHRASVKPKQSDVLVKILSSPLLVALGGISFPIFILHGPIGQICYKKVIAKQLFGSTLNLKYGPQFFYAYLAIVVASAWVTQKTFMSSKLVSNWSKSTVEKLSSKM